MKTLFAAASIALMGLTGAAAADSAENYPERPLMLMVSYGAGGATDFHGVAHNKPKGVRLHDSRPEPPAAWLSQESGWNCVKKKLLPIALL